MFVLTEKISLTFMVQVIKFIKIGAKVLRLSRYDIFQMAEVAIRNEVFAEILSRINILRCYSLY